MVKLQKKRSSTPCLGICSTTFGDEVCKGCKRFSHEIVNWTKYSLEEREIINDHIVITIEMLEQLPYPKNLRNVPEFAGGHHEKMDGTGYPKGLNESQMSTQAKIMAIADIYEALTAADRPYKDGKKLSQAMRIMGFMKNDYHIDEDLFEREIQYKIIELDNTFPEYIVNNKNKFKNWIL